MNETMRLLTNRRTYRNFDQKYQLSDLDLQQILDAARQAPSWMNGQFYSVIVIKDEAIRKQLIEWNPTNPHILESSVFLLFLGDLQRTKMVSETYQKPYLVDETIESIIMATTDAALALENAVIAVDSLGLGSVVVGSIRKFSKEISELLELPDFTLPLFGLSIGKPIVEMRVKPRLPEATIVHYDKYQPYSYELIEAYDKTMEHFAEARETKLWSQKFADYFATKPIMVVDQVARLKKIVK
ncbi:nitroreductase family protein [Enterococcus rivorum]|uniref:NADPH-dependent oxidoreductase n=1 Tax=Enterococcus rivorum TaxID=762845 RepID=A0A1E5KW41_9ENTE|nr:nitroreductase family protein [Enterococcus rivorum]MBP2100117.1 FMN reductase [NAD(P)H] [Enterococcus rivorum]OEH82093.1 NADPH-dependent oxidoreductase [Enterococcus rivorum]